VCDIYVCVFVMQCTCQKLKMLLLHKYAMLLLIVRGICGVCVMYELSLCVFALLFLGQPKDFKLHINKNLVYMQHSLIHSLIG